MSQQPVSILEPLHVKVASPFLDGLATTRVSSKNAKIIIDVSSIRKIALLVRLAAFENA